VQQLRNELESTAAAQEDTKATAAHQVETLQAELSSSKKAVGSLQQQLEAAVASAAAAAERAAQGQQVRL
jgi:uncharacterized coiled-coil protein SlyX